MWIHTVTAAPCKSFKYPWFSAAAHRHPMNSVCVSCRAEETTGPVLQTTEPTFALFHKKSRAINCGSIRMWGHTSCFMDVCMMSGNLTEGLNVPCHGFSCRSNPGCICFCLLFSNQRAAELQLFGVICHAQTPKGSMLKGFEDALKISAITNLF